MAILHSTIHLFLVFAQVNWLRWFQFWLWYVCAARIRQVRNTLYLCKFFYVFSYCFCWNFDSLFFPTVRSIYFKVIVTVRCLSHTHLNSWKYCWRNLSLSFYRNTCQRVCASAGPLWYQCSCSLLACNPFFVTDDMDKNMLNFSFKLCTVLAVVV